MHDELIEQLRQDTCPVLSRIRAADLLAELLARPPPPALPPPPAPPPPVLASIFMVDEMTVDLNRRLAVRADGTRVKLTTAEFAALATMVVAAPRPVTRDEVSQYALFRDHSPEDRSVDQLVHSLRQKLPPNAAGLAMISSVRTRGYALSAVVTVADGNGATAPYLRRAYQDHGSGEAVS